VKQILISAEITLPGKEEKYMNYEKPHVALVASAIETIKTSSKGQDPNPDSQFVTEPAYEADE